MKSWKTGSWMDFHPLYLKYRPIVEERLREEPGYENLVLTMGDLDDCVSLEVFEPDLPDEDVSEKERKEWDVPEGLELPVRDDNGAFKESAFIYALDSLDPGEIIFGIKVGEINYGRNKCFHKHS